MHTEALRERGEYAEVHCAFLKEEPIIADALDKIDSGNVCIVPDFLAEGYFTRQVIPEKLKLSQRSKNIRYCPPVGTHPMMAELIADAAADVIGEWTTENTSLLVIGHGSRKNACSKQTLIRHLHELRANSDWAQVQDLWLEESPMVGDWSKLASQSQVVIVPFLLNDGQHGGWDIPADLGITVGADIHRVTHQLKGRGVRLTPALGTSARFADVIAAIVDIWCGASD